MAFSFLRSGLQQWHFPADVRSLGHAFAPPQDDKA